MDQKGMGAAVLLEPAAMHYLAHFKSVSYSRPIILTVTHDQEILIVPALAEALAHEVAHVSEMRVYYEHPEKEALGTEAFGFLLDVLGGLQKDRGFLGIEDGMMSHAVARSLEESGWKLKDVGQEIARMRERKDEAELDLIRKAGALASLGVARSIEATQAGLSPMELEQVGNRAIVEEASRTLPESMIIVDANTVAGERAALPHVFTPSVPLFTNEMIIHSRQVEVEGYRAECERTYAIGQLSDQQREIFQVAIEAQWAGIAAVRPGIPCSAVDDASREVIRKAGYAECFIHRTGHGLGLEVHEAPYLRWDNDAVLEPGMVFSIEPAIFVRGLGGARHSDTVLVTETGYELLTDYPRALNELVLGPSETE
jgi:Xaa-Pro dipeptidase